MLDVTDHLTSVLAAAAGPSTAVQSHHLIPQSLAGNIVLSTLTSDAGRLLGPDLSFSINGNRNLLLLPTGRDDAQALDRTLHFGGQVGSYNTQITEQLRLISISPAGRQFLDVNLPDAARAPAAAVVVKWGHAFVKWGHACFWGKRGHRENEVRGDMAELGKRLILAN